MTIAAVAQAIGDQETYDIFYALYSERMRELSRSFWALKNKNSDSSGESPEEYEKRTQLTSWECGVLECEIDLEQCPLRHLEHIVKVVKETNDLKYIGVAEQMLMHKKDPMTACDSIDMREALELLDSILG